jgi:exosortase C (VPDSG-CTERM-specific)
VPKSGRSTDLRLHPQTGSPSPPARPEADPRAPRHRLKLLALFAVGLILCFCRPLFDLLRFAASRDLYSHVLLIPALSVYLAWVKRRELCWDFRPARGLAFLLAFLGASLLAGYWMALHSGWAPVDNDRLCVTTLGFLLFFSSGSALLLGAGTLRSLLFPLLFLGFLLPLPACLERGIEHSLQYGSAEAASAFIHSVGTPLARTGTRFQLPNITLEVAPECSGIHSTLVLFLTALVASYLLLRKRWTKVALVLSVIPLGILRNGFRIFTLAELCVYVNPNIIDSPLHHHGGPVFFAASLVPFFLLAWVLVKLDKRKRAGGETT